MSNWNTKCEVNGLLNELMDSKWGVAGLLSSPESVNTFISSNPSSTVATIPGGPLGMKLLINWTKNSNFMAKTTEFNITKQFIVLPFRVTGKRCNLPLASRQVLWSVVRCGADFRHCQGHLQPLNMFRRALQRYRACTGRPFDLPPKDENTRLVSAKGCYGSPPGFLFFRELGILTIIPKMRGIENRLDSLVCETLLILRCEKALVF